MKTLTEQMQELMQLGLRVIDAMKEISEVAHGLSIKEVYSGNEVYVVASALVTLGDDPPEVISHTLHVKTGAMNLHYADAILALAIVIKESAR